MRSLRRLLAVGASSLPALAVAQAADGAATGGSAWNWLIGIAAALVVLALAVEMFSRGAGRVRARRRA